MDNEHRVIPNGSVYVDDGKIISIGKKGEVKPPSSPEFVIDAKNKVVLPGFVNTHAHLEPYLRGVYELIGDFFDIMLPLNEFSLPDDVNIGLASCAEMIYGGATTTCCTFIHHLDSFAKAVEKAGNRAILGLVAPDVDLSKLDKEYTYLPKRADAFFKESINFYKNWHGKAEERITTILAPQALDFTTDETYLRYKEAAKKYDLDITTHLSQSWREVVQVKKKYGKTPPQHLYDIGLLNERVSVAHCTYATAKDTAIIKKSGAKILHCRSVTNPFLNWLDLGIPVGLGTDDIHHSMLPLLRQNLMGAESRAMSVRGYERIMASSRVTQRPSSYELLELATIKGAEVMNIDKDVGSLELGKKADIITVNMNTPYLTPTKEPLTSIVRYGTAADIDTVIVDGKILKRGGVIETFNMEKVLAQTQKAVHTLWNQFFEEYPEKKSLWETKAQYKIR